MTLLYLCIRYYASSYAPSRFSRCGFAIVYLFSRGVAVLLNCKMHEIQTSYAAYSSSA